jgi:hypothetical protein
MRLGVFRFWGIIEEMKATKKNTGRDGQAMLIAVLSLGGAILGATAVAGLLTLYQLRAVNDSANSAKAIFAADAGVEWTLFDYYCGMNGSCTNGAPSVDTDLPTFAGSGATLSVACSDASGASST